MWYDEAIDHILIEAPALQAKVAELGARITADYTQVAGNLLLVGVLKGALSFMVDLSRVITARWSWILWRFPAMARPPRAAAWSVF